MIKDRVQRMYLTKLTFLRLAMFSIALTVSAYVIANEEDNPVINTSNYPASFFAQYTPQNALEMVQKLPGFTFDEGSNARGFGGNAGNVLINDTRPTSKSGGLRGALIRIPAAQVLRIEILRGGVGAGEASGQSIVANVVKKDGGTSGTWGILAKRAPEGAYQPKIEAAITTKLGDWSTSFDTDIGGNPGYRGAFIETLDSSNNLSESANEVLKSRDQWMLFNGEGSRALAGGKLTLNTGLRFERWKSDVTRDVYVGQLPNSNNPDNFWKLNEKDKTKAVEVGVDWISEKNDWKWHVIGLGSAEDFHYKSKFYQEDIAISAVDENNFLQDSLKTEYIARLTYGKVGDSKFKPEYGVEIANNKLDSESEFIVGNETQNLEGANVIVEELRGEMFANFVHNMNSDFTFEGGVTAEISEIKVIGEVDQKKSYSFIKPRLSASYKIDEVNRLTLQADKSVGQLDFSDFASSANSSDDRITAGNSRLKPDRKTALTSTYDWSFSERGSVKIAAYYEWRKDILEQIILPSGNQGLGNAGNAEFWGVTADINLPLDYFLKDSLLEIHYINRKSNFNDPIIGRSRLISGYTPEWLSMKFRQDVTEHQFSWGMEYWGNFTDSNFYVDERQTFSGNVRLRMFLETTRFFGVKSLLEITNMNTGEYTRSRFLYENNRSGDYKGVEIARRTRRPEIKLSFSGTF